MKWNQPQPQLCVIFIRKRFPFILPETTLSKIEATLNYLQTFTRESIFQYGMNYEVNFQIKNEMTCVPSFSFMLHQNWGDPQQDKFIFISKGRLKKM